MFDSKVLLELFFEHHEHIVGDIGTGFFFHLREALAMQGLYDGVEADVEFFCYLN